MLKLLDLKPPLANSILFAYPGQEHVFARKLLARSVDVASTWSTRSNMDAITLDGDLCSRKGALTGGFVDQSKSRLFAHMELKKSEDALKNLEKEHREMKSSTTAVDQQVSNIMGEVQRLEAKHANLDHMMSRIEDEAGKLEKTTDKHSGQIKQIEEDIPPMESEITSFDGQIERLQDEIGVSKREFYIHPFHSPNSSFSVPTSIIQSRPLLLAPCLIKNRIFSMS